MNNLPKPKTSQPRIIAMWVLIVLMVVGLFWCVSGMLRYVSLDTDPAGTPDWWDYQTGLWFAGFMICLVGIIGLGFALKILRNKN